MENIPSPGGPLASRPLHFILMLDCSGSMAHGGKIQALNQAIKEAVPHMRDAAAGNPEAQLLVRAIKFSSGAQWHISQPQPVDNFTWSDISADGVTDMGKALCMVAEQLSLATMPKRALPPVLLLITDGQPTDDFNGGLKKLMAEPWGKKAVRLGIAIGEDAEHDVLEKFIANPEIPVLQAGNPESLVKLIRWASTVVTSTVSNPKSADPNDPNNGRIPIPAPPTNPGPGDPGDVW